MIYDKFYLEYRGSLPKSGNEYLVPEVAYDCLIELTKYYAIRNKKGVSQWERRDQDASYIRERGNMTKVMGRMKLEDIIHSALLVPQFNYNGNGCYTPCNVSSGGGASVTTQPVLVTNTQYVNVPSPAPPLSTHPTIITFEGSEAVGGIVYNNSLMAGQTSMRVFSNVFNRFLTSSEFNILPTGGIDLSPLGTQYLSGDWFDIFVRWT